MSVAPIGSAPVTHGADVQALQDWSAAAGETAQRFDDVTARLDRAVVGLAWSGPDQHRFAEEWQTRFSPTLRTIGSALQTASGDVARHADEQQHASTDGGALGGGRPGGGTGTSDAEREAQEAAWARGAGRLVLGALGSAIGGPVGALVGAVGGPRLVDRMVGVADAQADRTSVTEVRGHGIADRLPTGPADLLHDMADMYDREGQVRLDMVTRPDGSQVALLYVPGTQDWSIDADTASPMGSYGAVAAASGKDSPLRVLMLEAMDEVPEGVPIHVATHSQSGFAALDLAADPYVRARHDIASVVTTGAGGGNFEVPPGTQVVSVRNPYDPVARIGGAPAGAIEVSGSWDGAHPHSSREYANLVGRTSSPALDGWWRSVGIDPGSNLQTRVFEGTVAPRD